MADLTVTEAFADLTTAVSRSLAVICRQLIDREALSEESLIADLTSLGAALESEGASAAGRLAAVIPYRSSEARGKAAIKRRRLADSSNPTARRVLDQRTECDIINARHVASGFAGQARQMSVRKRKWITRRGEQKEAWIVDYTDQDGDRHIETFEKKKDADAFQATVRVDVSKGEHIAPSKSETVAEAAERWLKRVEADGRERTTVRQYRQHVNLHIAPRIGAIKLAHLTSAKIETFRDELLANLSRPLARKILTSLKSLLKIAKRAHVAADVSIGRDKRKRRLEVGIDIPTPDEIKRLLKAAAEADIRPRALLTVTISTGLRASELRGLRWKDVDLKHSEVHVRQRADRFNVIGPPKSETSVRKIGFGSHTLAAMREWKLACPKGELDLVFPTGEGRVEHHKNMLRSLAPVLTAANVVDKGGEPKYALHAIRHFYASWCLNRKADGGRELPPKNVQQLLGHSSIVITMDLYGHLFPASNDRAELATAEAALWT